MVRPSLRSTRLRKIRKRIPGGAFIIHYFKRKPGVAKCAICGKPLHGVPRVRTSFLKKLSRSKKKPSRPYGGNLCSKCMREKFRERVRK